MLSAARRRQIWRPPEAGSKQKDGRPESDRALAAGNRIETQREGRLKASGADIKLSPVVQSQCFFVDIEDTGDLELRDTVFGKNTDDTAIHRRTVVPRSAKGRSGVFHIHTREKVSHPWAMFFWREKKIRPWECTRVFWPGGDFMTDPPPFLRGLASLACRVMLFT
ncbi:hypothetical protein [Rhizobium leguminosarum]|uniref:hypothetical protein n=1 Tax=Rhizobium leguminosarum TaxID=384 RepID=UPI00161E8EFA|nr:hypothetical protein [Rhizobium leguminosarum]MBB4339530.1 hypothetical protein [Rhizobium leguminosarum]MBB6291759.1 hypothetical protein [Rhizobium leguminosarum]